jgi:hypothetical protein
MPRRISGTCRRLNTQRRPSDLQNRHVTQRTLT